MMHNLLPSFHDRLPPEALIDGVYSLPGDVYMWAMMVYEMLQGYQMVNNITCVPYCMVPDSEVSPQLHVGIIIQNEF